MFLRERKLTQKRFCSITGFAEKNLSNFINGTVKSPRIDIITSILEFFPELNLRWLLLGQGNIWQDSNPPIPLPDDKVSADRFRFADQKINKDLLNELISTKDQLIRSQEKRIEQLEEEILRLKKQ